MEKNQETVRACMEEAELRIQETRRGRPCSPPSNPHSERTCPRIHRDGGTAAGVDPGVCHVAEVGHHIDVLIRVGDGGGGGGLCWEP